MFNGMTGREEFDAFMRATEHKLRHVYCPTHRQPPQVSFVGSSLRDVTIRMTGCCARVMELANAAIAGRTDANAGPS